VPEKRAKSRQRTSEEASTKDAASDDADENQLEAGGDQLKVKDLAMTKDATDVE